MELALALLKQLPQPCLLCDASLKILAVSRTLSVGLGNRRLLGEPLSALSPGDAALTRAARQALSEERVHRLSECTVLGESALPCCVELQPLSGLDPAVLLVCLTLPGDRDARPDALARQMARALSHEIRNPLGGLRGAAQLLSRARSDCTEYTDIIIAEADRISGLVDRVLYERQPQHALCNIHVPLERARRLLEAQAEAGLSALKVQRDYDPSLPETLADTEQLLQALLNLLQNAVQANAQNLLLKTRAERQVRLGARLLRKAIRIDVQDDGLGVPENLRDTLFLPLVTGRTTGCGFGLATTLAIAEEHGGGLRYHSRPGDTVFSLFLPVRGL